MTRLDQIKAAFPDHWRTILDRMTPAWRCIYLSAPASGGAYTVLSGAFIWEQSPEGHAHWARLAHDAEWVRA